MNSRNSWLQQPLLRISRNYKRANRQDLKTLEEAEYFIVELARKTLKQHLQSKLDLSRGVGLG
jgi:hypothetical protein